MLGGGIDISGGGKSMLKLRTSEFKRSRGEVFRSFREI